MNQDPYRVTSRGRDEGRQKSRVNLPNEPMEQGYYPIVRRSVFGSISDFIRDNPREIFSFFAVVFLICGGLTFLYYLFEGLIPAVKRVVGWYYGYIDDMHRLGPFSAEGSKSLLPFLFISVGIAVILRRIVLWGRRGEGRQGDERGRKEGEDN